MVEQAVAELPNECCGLFAGHLAAGVGTVTHRLPLVNAAASPREFLSEPRSMLAAEKAMRAAGVEMLAIYHSHPTSAAVPSATDRARNYSESMLNLIISLAGGQADVQAWWLTATDFEAGEWGFAEDSET
jgi:proteasome lid subunit RPN8/RPN11